MRFDPRATSCKDLTLSAFVTEDPISQVTTLLAVGVNILTTLPLESCLTHHTAARTPRLCLCLWRCGASIQKGEG
jgi:hypothetical protein